MTLYYISGQIIPYPQVSVTLFHILTTKGLKDKNDSKSKVANPVHTETDPTSFTDKATSQKCNPYPSLEKKVRRSPAVLLMIKHLNQKTLDVMVKCTEGDQAVF